MTPWLLLFPIAVAIACLAFWRMDAKRERAGRLTTHRNPDCFHAPGIKREDLS